MIRITDDAAIIQLFMTKGLGSRTLNRLLDAANAKGLSFTDIVEMAPEALVREFQLKPGVSEAVTTDLAASQALTDRLEARGIRVLVRYRNGYPTRLHELLGDDAPPVLFTTGDISLLDRDGVGFCGSRKCSERGLGITEHAAAALARDGINVISGYAAGVDTMAHRAALDAGGTTTIVLAEGILKFRPKGEISELLDEGSAVIVSQFYPDARWVVHNAMQRNSTVCALSKAVILVESGMEGGTFEAGKVAQSLRLPLFVVEFASPAESAKGNGYFLDRGACSIRSDGSGRPSMDAVINAVRSESVPLPPEEESGLFDTR